MFGYSCRKPATQVETHYCTLSLFSAAPVTSNNAEMDLLGSLSDSLAIVPTASVTTASEADIHTNSAPSSTFVAAPSVANVVNQVGIVC